MADKRPVQIMTSIAYVNGAPHVGHALEYVQADIYARYYRMRGHDVYFLTGTDEHGSKIYKAAKDNSMGPQDFADMNSQKFRIFSEHLNMSFDDFIRTTDQKRHWPAVIKIWNLLQAAGLLEKRMYEGIYCMGCEAFKTEKDLINGICPDHPTTPIQKIAEENYFFLLSKFTSEIRTLLQEKVIHLLPEHRANEILAMMKDGLLDVSFSRAKEVLPWGVPVPNDDSQVMYVWCDALTNYISACGFAEESDTYKKYWANSDSRRIHFVGKDILRFHATIWPGMLLAAKIPLPTDIRVHGYISSNGQRMSKSTGNVVDPEEYISEFGADALRYYLAREIPASEDGDFTRARFIELYNGELANNLGNLVQRVVAMAIKNEIMVDMNVPVLANVAEFDRALDQHLEKFEIHQAVNMMMKHFKSFNQWIDEKKPWELAKTDKTAVAQVLSQMLNTIRAMIPYVEIFLPDTAKKIRLKLGLNPDGSGEIKPQVTEGLFMTKKDN
ncbi:MAG: methionine--tRNA ligase [Candidatus Abawacabacteria bacterium]|nr:methionine--tRNA ligase [Candidatus Abawacabacteria bacterium]